MTLYIIQTDSTQPIHRYTHITCNSTHCRYRFSQTPLANKNPPFRKDSTQRKTRIYRIMETIMSIDGNCYNEIVRPKSKTAAEKPAETPFPQSDAGPPLF